MAMNSGEIIIIIIIIIIIFFHFSLLSLNMYFLFLFVQLFLIITFTVCLSSFIHFLCLFLLTFVTFIRLPLPHLYLSIDPSISSHSSV